MTAHQAAHAIATMCRVLEVSASGYYAWRPRTQSARAQADARLVEAIRAIHARARGTYGAPRIHAELVATGTRVSRKRIARLMRTAGVCGVSRRTRPRTTVRGAATRPAPDLVCRAFTAAGPNQLWVADITDVSTGAGFLYLAVVLDAWSRRIVGGAMAPHLRSAVVVGALEMAVRHRQPAAVIHHSDQGCQSTSLAFGQRCREAGVRPSMGSVGDGYDNAMCESFFATLECELLERHAFPTQREARTAIFDFVEGWYNTHRRHSALAYKSPISFERRYAANRAADRIEAAGSVDAENASTRSLENAQNAFPTAPTRTPSGITLMT
jgi:putative transposase